MGRDLIVFRVIRFSYDSKQTPRVKNRIPKTLKGLILITKNIINFRSSDNNIHRGCLSSGVLSFFKLVFCTDFGIGVSFCYHT